MSAPRKLNRLADGTVLYKCPCGDTHAINDKRWQVSGSEERPTFSPSVLVTTGHYVGGGRSAECWCTYNRAHPDRQASFTCYRCHSFVRDGQVQFLADCTHPLAGQTVPLEDWS